ncbi:DNA-processing protein DprA [Nocardia sp. BSTN01]|uniref:DNA-processing protein DprA n=1 Tax=Nocardia sp. BSTN01 TaxID=2783665 RepID=UPI00188FF9EF|nr:DNA-processing protein DprA [Nocardia sp. BSTN01]MBF4999142.1 DNA-processing protein DprA [Nocardia sp. BSTN01]
MVTRDDAEWPWQLARLDRATQSGPFALYLRGPVRLDTVIERAITITGSRAATGYGRAVTDRIAAELTTLGWNVSADSAYGVAAIAHKAALAAHGHPVAVLAAGIDVAHPPGHSGLLATVATSGVLVSEYPPGTSVTRARRRAQTRLLAALSRAVLESTPGGEPATIAAHAVRHRVPVFAVPGPVTSATTALPHELIATGRARLTTSGHDIHHFMS